VCTIKAVKICWKVRFESFLLHRAMTHRNFLVQFTGVVFHFVVCILKLSTCVIKNHWLWQWLAHIYTAVRVMWVLPVTYDLLWLSRTNAHKLCILTTTQWVYIHPCLYHQFPLIGVQLIKESTSMERSFQFHWLRTCSESRNIRGWAVSMHDFEVAR